MRKRDDKYKTRVSDKKREKAQPKPAVYSSFMGRPLKGNYQSVNSDPIPSKLSDMPQAERERILSGKPPSIPKRHFKVFSDEWEERWNA